MNLTREEKNKVLTDKAIDLLFWFMGRELPPTPFQLTQGETCIDCEKMVLSALYTMEAYADNPFSRAFVAAYLRLNSLKIYMQNEAIKQTGGKRGKRQKAANSGN